MNQKIRFHLSAILMLMLLSLSSTSWAGKITHLKTQHLDNKTQLTFDLNHKTTPKIFSLKNPPRIVIDLSNTQKSIALKATASKSSQIKQIRQGARPNNTLRVVLDLKKDMHFNSEFSSKNNQHKLLLTLSNTKIKQTQAKPPTTKPAEKPKPAEHAAAKPIEKPKPAEHAAAKPIEKPKPAEHAAAKPIEKPKPVEHAATKPIEKPKPVEHAAAKPIEKPKPAEHAVAKPIEKPKPVEHAAAKPIEKPKPVEHAAAKPIEKPKPAEHVAAVKTAPPKPIATNKPTAKRDILIAIDAGHGGKDQGAKGLNGTKEKVVTLEIARRLAKLINAEQGMKAYLTRDSDVFISLRGRVQRARKQKADMFISIHADAFHDQRARGSSVFVLSERGASSEAAKLIADKENAADLVGGVSLNDKDDMLASVLVDLSQNASLEASYDVASTILSGLKRIGNIHKKKVEAAGFVVLKSPDIPSVLVETAFITNPAEERRLLSATHQNKLARAILTGIRSYFRKNPLAHSTLTHQQHIVSAGESLGLIAMRYQVGVRELKKENNLSDNTIKVGQTLKIP